LVVAALTGVVAAGTAGKPDGLSARMRGTWKVVKTSENGREVAGRKSTMSVSGNKMTLTWNDDVSASTFKVDDTKSPAWIDVKTGDREPRKGLIEITGDTMRLAYEPADDKRPAGFESDGVFVIELVRDGSATTRPTTATAPAGATTESAGNKP
jgi:uncharacterized protein (TIGR03067 family)